PAASAEEAVRGADIVTTMTSAARPVVEGRWLSPGAHVNAAGSNSLLKSEVDEETVARAGLVVVDSRAAAELEGGDLLAPLQKGRLALEALVELGAVVSGRCRGREVKVAGTDRETLLVAWLQELVFLFEVEDLVFCAFEIRSVSETELEAVARGCAWPEERPRTGAAVKAVTYYGLCVEEADSGW